MFRETFEAFRAIANAYPDAYEETPWGELVLKVRKKVFVFLACTDSSMSVTVKLPASRAFALENGFCSPTGYGLGKHGWVSAKITEVDDLDLPTLLGWLEESYRAVAPKSLAKQVPAGGPLPAQPTPIPSVPEDAALVVIVSDDPRRADRAIREFAHHGMRAERATTDMLEDLADTDAVLLMVDLGRSTSIAMEIAGQLAMLHFDVPLALVGIRDVQHEAKARELIPDAAVYSREPPGDPTLVATLAT